MGLKIDEILSLTLDTFMFGGLNIWCTKIELFEHVSPQCTMGMLPQAAQCCYNF